MPNWKPIPTWENIYEISDDGEVRGLHRTVYRRDGSMQTWPASILAGSVNSAGYRIVRLSDGCTGRRAIGRVHRLVAVAFLPNPLSLPQINHKDGNKLNNRIDNLEWCTAADNISHAISNGLGAYLPPGGGKLTPEMRARIISALAHGQSKREIARQFGIHRASVRYLEKKSLPPPPAENQQ